MNGSSQSAYWIRSGLGIEIPLGPRPFRTAVVKFFGTTKARQNAAGAFLTVTLALVSPSEKSKSLIEL